MIIVNKNKGWKTIVFFEATQKRLVCDVVFQRCRWHFWRKPDAITLWLMIARTHVRTYAARQVINNKAEHEFIIDADLQCRGNSHFRSWREFSNLMAAFRSYSMIIWVFRLNIFLFINLTAFFINWNCIWWLTAFLRGDSFVMMDCW